MPEKLYKKENKLLTRLSMSSSEKDKDTIKRQIQIVNENLRMIEGEN